MKNFARLVDSRRQAPVPFINRLPQELLIMILKSVVYKESGWYYESLEALRSAYTKWAKAVDGDPWFWTVLADTDPKQTRRAAMERSAHLPLDVFVTRDNQEPYELEDVRGDEGNMNAAFLKEIKHTAPRWRSLTLCVEDMAASRVPLYVKSSFASLELLDIENYGSAFPLKTLFPSATGPPHLRSFSILHCNVWGPVAFPNLATIHIGQLGGDVAKLAAMLETCPLLEKLSIAGGSFKDSELGLDRVWDDTQSRLNLPALRSLSLWALDADRVRVILDRLNTTQLKYLRVNAEGARGRRPEKKERFERLLHSLHRWLAAFSGGSNLPELDITLLDNSAQLALENKLDVVLSQFSPLSTWDAWTQMAHSINGTVRTAITSLSFTFESMTEDQAHMTLAQISQSFPSITSLKLGYRVTFYTPSSPPPAQNEQVLKALARPLTTDAGQHLLFPNLHNLEAGWSEDGRDVWFDLIKARLQAYREAAALSITLSFFGHVDIQRADYDALEALGISLKLGSRGIIREVSASTFVTR